MDKRYALMWMPRDGLFYDGGSFLTGKQEVIPWRREIVLYKTHSRAEVAKERLIKKYPDAKGEYIIVSVILHEVD